jgi:dihydroorotate dehydrogenase electron transfer subunit
MLAHSAHQGKTCQSQAALYHPKVTSIENLARGLYLLHLSGFGDSFQPQAGQFLHIRTVDSDFPLLRRPISIQAWQQDTVTLLIREVGAGTRLLHQLNPGDRLDVLGPLGTPFSPIGEGERVLLVGGGVGVAPLVACCLEANPESTLDFCYGTATAAEIQDLSLLNCPSELNVHYSTDDGSHGYPGYCTTVAEQLLKEQTYSKVFTCGPWIMMKTLYQLASRYQVPLEASLEVQMGCGLGACLGCVYETLQGEFIRACIDGPVVDAYRVKWNSDESFT